MIKDIVSKNEKAFAGKKEIEVLKAYFPQCFTSDGEFDIEKFRASLPTEIKVSDETTGFNFLGKNYARMLTNMDTTTLIRPDIEHNAKPENKDSRNVYISGDNLDALQHLVKSYAGKVKVIYIDPPYNTGSDGFVYNDKFSFTPEELAKRLDITPERASRILSMTKRGSASHAAWLTFMLPRLSFARDLLTKDGVIFISIDDNEQANLKCLCDEVFGEENFIANIIWKHTQQSKNDEPHFSRQYNHLVCFAKNKDLLNNFYFERIEEDNANYSNPDNDPKGDWRSGDVRSPSFRATLCYDIVAPNGNIIKAPENGWRWSEDTLKEKLHSGEIIFKKDYSGIIRKIYLCEQSGRTPENLWDSLRFGSTRQAASEIKELFDNKQVFETPKPVALIKGILEIASNKDCLIMDFFGGSSTSAHAIMLMNRKDNGNRKYILVQCQESCKTDSEAFKAGYKTIDQIGMERIKQASKKLKDENPLFAGDLGFKHYILEEPKEDALLKMEQFDPTKEFLTTLTANDFGVDSVLRTWLVADGYGLTEDAEEVNLDGYTAYYKGNHLYLINPDDNFTAGSIAALMDKYNGEAFSPQNIVIFGYSFGFTHREELQKNLRTLKEGNKTLTVNIDVRY